MSDRPVWTDLVPFLLLFSMAIYTDLGPKEKPSELIQITVFLGGLCFVMTKFGLQGMSPLETVASMTIPVGLTFWFLEERGELSRPGIDGVLILGLLMVVCVPLTVIGLRRSALTGIFRYLFALTVGPVFILCVFTSAIFIGSNLPWYGDLARDMGSRFGGAWAYPVAALTLASGWIWYQLFKLLQAMLTGDFSRTAPDDSDPDSLMMLAKAYAGQGQYEQAEMLFKHALAIRERTLGPDHLDVATTLENLAALYGRTNRGIESAALSKRADTIRAKSK